MASKRFWLRLLVMSLAFAMTAVGCNDDIPESKPETDPALNGTWETQKSYIYNNGDISYYNDGSYIDLNNGEINYYYDGKLYKYGNFTTTREGTITITYTYYDRFFLEDYLSGYGTQWMFPLQDWYSRNDLKNKIPENKLNELFSPHTYTYFITDSAEGEILTIGEDSFKRIYF